MAGDQIRVFNLYYRQSWLDEAVVVKVGQIAVDDDFMLSDYAGLFLNSAFGAMPSQVGTPLATSCGNNTAFPIYSVAAPGLLLRVQSVESFYSQLGLYYGNPGPDESDNYGFDWVNQSPAELGLFWENGLNYKVFQRAGTFKAGLSYHTGPIDDFSIVYNGNAPVEKQTVPNYYAVNDFQLLADKEGHTKLGLFCRGGFTPDPNLSMVGMYADAGLNWFAPLPTRPDDMAGVAVSYTKFGESFRQSTGPNGIAADETTVEFTYKAQLARWLTVQADTQLLFNPAANPGYSNREMAVVLGMRAVITF
jgi:porin